MGVELTGVAAQPGPPRTVAFPVIQTNLGVGTANDGIYVRVVDGQDLVSKIAVEVNVASGNVCVAVFRNTGSGSLSRPGTRVATSGSVACPASGYREIALGSSVAVAPGDWLYFGADNTTAKIRGFGNAVSTALGNGVVHTEAAAFPAPATASPATSGGNPLILLGVA